LLVVGGAIGTAYGVIGNALIDSDAVYYGVPVAFALVGGLLYRRFANRNAKAS
jgi:hypothetical protein